MAKPREGHLPALIQIGKRHGPEEPSPVEGFFRADAYSMQAGACSRQQKIVCLAWTCCYQAALRGCHSLHWLQPFLGAGVSGGWHAAVRSLPHYLAPGEARLATSLQERMVRLAARTRLAARSSEFRKARLKAVARAARTKSR